MRKANLSVVCRCCNARVGRPCTELGPNDYRVHTVRLKDALVATVGAVGWRMETSLCREFGSSSFDPPTEDALFELVKEKRLLWVERTNRPFSPLCYRLPTAPPIPGEIHEARS